MNPRQSNGRTRIVIRPTIRPPARIAVLTDEWQRQGRPHFISKRAFQARRSSPAKAVGLNSTWAELKKWLFGE